MSYAMAPAGLGFTMPAVVLENMDRVNDEIFALDKDIKSFSPSQSFLGEWVDFINAPQDTADDFDVAPPRGWRRFYKDYSGIASRMIRSDSILKRTGEFEWRFVEFYDKFVSIGGTPTQPRPTPGSVKPTPDRTTQDDLVMWLKIAAVVGGLAATGYFLRSLPSFDIGRSKRRKTSVRV